MAADGMWEKLQVSAQLGDSASAGRKEKMKKYQGWYFFIFSSEERAGALSNVPRGSTISKLCASA